MRRLKNDLAALERLQSESTVFRFKAHGDPPQRYLIIMKGKSLWRNRGQVVAHFSHQIEIKLGASYPRTVPEIRWITPIYHPNISEIGMVCLGGYGTHWVPSIQLDELCNMLWDMARYHNYDIRSPYNREAALWVATQTSFLFPVDARPLRDARAAQGRIEPSPSSAADGNGTPQKDEPKRSSTKQLGPVEGELSGPERVRQFMRRYGGIFTKPSESANLIQPPRAEPEQSNPGDHVEWAVPADPDPPADHSNAHEFIVLDSASVTEPTGEAPREDDGITFIE
jgi:ubiquitin-protein ligase